MARRRGMLYMIFVCGFIALACFGAYTIYQSPTGQKMERVTKAAVRAGSEAVEKVSKAMKKKVKKKVKK